MATVHLHNDTGYAQQIRTRTHQLQADEPLDNQGGDTGRAPYELLLAALVACPSLTLRMYANRKDWELGGIHIDARLSRDDCGLENIERTVRFGNALTPEQLRRLADICEKTPVTKTLREGTPVRTALS